MPSEQKYQMQRPFDPEPQWGYAKAFFSLGLLGGAAFGFWWARLAAFPPPLPPGVAGCGTGFLIVPFLLMFGTPVWAACFAFLAGSVGALIDYLLNDGRQQKQ